ncbi:hypothetical protein Bca52824_086737 [Brassica carinata]|uniref:Uncharacterized protein n=1 Tax=Brassica carinata TaxID=52824 RepID=A0A8X7TMI1_BRACI|nr:hypothetical protein Bca52824_086737 [Brassica carinata]
MSVRDTSSSRTLKRLASQAVIYSIWRERNNRLHASTSSTSATIASSEMLSSAIGQTNVSTV